LAESQKRAADFAAQYEKTSPSWAVRFKIIEAQAASWRGLDKDVLTILSVESLHSADPDSLIRRLSLIAGADADLHRYDDAKQYLARADTLCSRMDRAVCSHVLDAHASFALEGGRNQEALSFYLQELAVARRFNERFDEAATLINLANTCLHEEHFDEAIDWLNMSNKIAEQLDAEDILLTNTGNLGWAYYSLGDRSRALELFQDAERRAVALGDIQGTILWLTTGGYVYQDARQWSRATESYRDALQLARNINDTQEIINALEDLAYVSIDAGDPDQAEAYLRKVDLLVTASGNRLDALDVMLARGRIAAARRQGEVAEGLFRQVEADPASQITMRLGAEHELARLYEAEGHPEDARKEYVTALGTFESAREEIKNEDSKLPYFANATPIYDDYIRLLIAQGKPEEALEAADRSRARTLEQGLGIESGKASLREASLRPELIAAKSDATLLFYWLGEQQSWLWAITPRKTQVFALPSQRTIAQTVERYRQELLGPEDPLSTKNADGLGLYQMLVAPAKELLAPGGKVVVLCDGVLSELNFETLLVDNGNPSEAPHYWIDDADVVSAPSMLMLARATPEKNAGGRLLLVGDAESPGPDYPELPNAPVEMQEIEKHFHPQQATVFTRDKANAAAYLSSDPQRFAYIDFVAHGVASRTDPLDSAIILSRRETDSRSGVEDSFKLYAREIMQHPIDARLVTIAACYGGGTRSYAGEGLVGLSWAFLRAGAHNVIGALWEVSDASAPRLMDALYQGLQDGLPPSAALRAAKLKLLHGTETGEFRRPFYWGSFQLYSVQ
jgi:CHAT domain-containing protein/Tfp pilus assembly protein PilF